MSESRFSSVCFLMQFIHIRKLLLELELRILTHAYSLSQPFAKSRYIAKMVANVSDGTSVNVQLHIEAETIHGVNYVSNLQI